MSSALPCQLLGQKLEQSSPGSKYFMAVGG